MSAWAFISALALSSAAQAQIVCTANEQCRGDAMRMCAPSELSIEVKRRSSGHIGLWIDHQGPYAATRARLENAERYTLESFGAYLLEIEDSGAFLYRGNRGKRYRGTCTGAMK